ncbi:MAG: hypothetical protein Q4G30_06230 [Actinomycetaceae bacterium]|nr:hypothetical protein [Actinomycetaceae bacterium]
MSDMTPEALSPQTAERIARAPMPTQGTLRRRKNILFQLPKFALFNFRILQIVTMIKLSHKK